MRLDASDRAKAYGIFCMADILVASKKITYDEGCDGVFDFAEYHYYNFTNTSHYHNDTISEYDAMRNYVNENI